MENGNGKRNMTARYAFLHGNYWMIQSAVFGYASVFLLSRNFSAGSIGMLAACGNVLAVVMQQYFASFADRTRRFTIKDIMVGITCAGLVPAVLLLILPGSGPVIAGLYILIMALSNTLQPLLNAINGYYERRGYEVNFGLARGIGSLTYAAFSFVWGHVVNTFGENVVPMAIVAIFCMILAALAALPMSRGNDKEKAASGTAEERAGDGTAEERAASGTAKERAASGTAEERAVSGIAEEARTGDSRAGDRETEDDGRQDGANGSIFCFIKKYKLFFVLLSGIVLSFAFHNMSNTYLIQIMTRFGGSSADMGTSIAIAAACELPMMFLFSRVVKVVKSNQLLRIAGIGFFLKALAVWAAGSVAMVHVSQIFQAVSFAVMIPASVYYADEVMDEEDRVRGQALITMACTVGGLVGSLTGGKIIDMAGVQAMLTAGVVSAGAGMALIFAAAVPAGKRKSTVGEHLS